MHIETVSMILMKRNPHYICGARILVKPYREKSKSFDRNHMEKYKPPVYYPSRHLEMDPVLHSMTGASGSSIFLKKQRMGEQEKMLEHGRRHEHLSVLNLAQMPLNQQSFFSYEDFELPQGYNEFPLEDHFNYTLDAMNNGAISNDKARQASNNYSDRESEIDLPESPFASLRMQHFCSHEEMKEANRRLTNDQ